MYTFDYPLFLLLNFDGGPVMDTLMKVISTPASWAWLYILILWLVWRKSGWRGALLFLVLVAAAVGLSDLIAGIFKHSGPLQNLWREFPVRLRPMFNENLHDVHVVSFKHGLYGTVSAHAATIVSLAVLTSKIICRRWFTWMMVGVAILICYSRIYLACHFPQDILIGATLGIASGFAGYWIFKLLLRDRERAQ